MKNHSQEIYKGQRAIEKRELFRHFRLRAIKNIYKNKFFALFDHQCFKCGIKEKPYAEIGKPPVLCIDHHIPMVLGGHLIPGNLVSLCRSCNNKKLDHPPEEFYTPEELDKLKSFLDKQGDIFVFNFDWSYWKRDRKGYLISLGIEPHIVDEVLSNPNHPDYIEPIDLLNETSSQVITIDMSDFDISGLMKTKIKDDAGKNDDRS